MKPRKPIVGASCAAQEARKRRAEHKHHIDLFQPIVGVEDGNGWFYIDVSCRCGRKGWLARVKIDDVDVDWSAGCFPTRKRG